MSGGSMDYLFYKVDYATFKVDTDERKRVRKFLARVAMLLKAIEWNDSGDGDIFPNQPTEQELIRELLPEIPSEESVR